MKYVYATLEWLLNGVAITIFVTFVLALLWQFWRIGTAVIWP